MSLDPALRSRIESLLQANRVVLFMKGQPGAPQCGFSAKASGVLEDLGVEYGHVNVLADQEIREGIKTFGNWPTIPQLYVDGELVGGSDIIEQMASSGELSQLLGLPPPDRTPPQVTVTEAAAEKLRGALADAGNGALALAIDARFQPRFQIAPRNDTAIAVETAGLRIQFDPASARRAHGITIDWVDDFRGQGLAIDNPNAPRPVQAISPSEADRQVRSGELVLVDVRPGDERAIAAIGV
ncbi:MAG: Grx4 family monothiol glutaredoxin, partial [Xanthomonadaceae bacterium]|nr:Grx4 family monothiol glutaredoxin [Xanthomonadaceae bacterium]